MVELPEEMTLDSQLLILLVEAATTSLQDDTTEEIVREEKVVMMTREVVLVEVSKEKKGKGKGKEIGEITLTRNHPAEQLDMEIRKEGITVEIEKETMKRLIERDQEITNHPPITILNKGIGKRITR